MILYCHLQCPEKKTSEFFVLSFHEFLSDLPHIYRVNRWGLGVFLGTQKFRILTHKSNIFQKIHFFDFSKMAIFGGLMSKIEIFKNWCYQNGLYHGFGSKFEFSGYPKKLPILTYSTYKYEVNRIKTHEIRAKRNPTVFFPSLYIRTHQIFMVNIHWYVCSMGESKKK